MRMLVAVVAAVAASAAWAVTPGENEYDMAHTRPLASGHGSDPFVTPCTNKDTGTVGYCLYSSQDTGFPPSSGNGTFMMGYTRGFFSVDGVTWEDKGIMATESQFPWVPANTYHFWAQCLYTDGGGYDPLYRLYVPDVPVGGNNQYHYNAGIGELTSTSPFGPFTYVGKMAQVTPYMSDPEVFPKGPDTSRTGGSRYLLWADGDNSTCGGLSIAKMSNDVSLWTRSEGYRINFTNIGDMKNELGTCTPDVALPAGYTKFDGPYLEGPSLYDLPAELPGLQITDRSGTARTYMLVFPSKPSKVPDKCKQEGQPGSDKQVIAYALSDSITGPYEYQGILMCGSDKEWTNHMNLQQLKTAGGSPRPVIYYHDSPGGDAPHRKLLAECIYAVDSNPTQPGGWRQISLIDRDTRDGLSWCMGNSQIFALYSTSTKKYVQENSWDQTYPNALRVRSTHVGAWEQFTATPMGGDKWGIQARLTRQYVTADFTYYSKLVATRDAIREWETFVIKPLGKGIVTLQTTNNGSPRWVRIKGDELLADQTSEANAEKFQMVYLYGN